MSRHEWRRKIIRCAAVVASAATMAALLPLAPASAAPVNYTRRCQADYVPTCALSFPNFPGGTISIDIDASGTGTGHWILFWNGAYRICETDYDLVAPAQSWVCHNVPAGNYVLHSMGQLNTTWHELGVRW